MVCALMRGHFPYRFAWLIDNPLRRVLVTPERLADRLPITADSCVLEVGPGSGYFSVELARRTRSGRLEWLDLQPEMLAKARRKLRRAGMRHVGYTVANASNPLPFPDETFDIAVLVAVLGEVPNAESSLGELYRVLRDGGSLAIHEHVPDPDRIDFPALRTLAESQGFNLDSRWGPSWNYTATFRRQRA